MTDDGWEKVAAPPPDDGWEPVTAAERPAPDVGEALPEAFMARVRAGEALGRVLQATAKGAAEGAGPSTPTGFEDDTLNYLIEKGVFHDPATGRPGPLQMANEAVLMPAAQLWQGITRAISGGIHGAGGAMEQVVTEFGGSSGEAARAKREVINLGNWAMIEGGMGRFSRPTVESIGPMDRPVGGLPRPEDFQAASKVLESPHAEANLRRMWSEDGIHPAEAVHDAATDAFVKHEITAPREVINLVPKALDERIDALKAEKRGFEQTTGNWVLPKAGAADDPLYQALSAADSPGYNFETWSENARWAKENGREDIAQVILDRMQRRAEQSSTTPGVAPESPKFEAIKKRLEEDKQQLQSEVDRLAEELKLKPTDYSVDPDIEALIETGGKPGSLSAAVTEPGDVPLDVQPPRPPGSLSAAAQRAAETLFDVGRDIQMKLAPMARGSVESMATVKDYMNAMRRNAWDWSRIDTDLQKRFTPEQRARMWNAMDEESLSLRLGEPESARQHQGLATLTPEERAAVVDLDTRQQLAWLKARDLGMVEGDGIAMHAPRMVINIEKGALDREGAMPLDAMGYDLRTRTPGMKHRKYVEVEETEKAAKAKYGDQAVVARDIRTVALSTAQLEDAIAGRTLIENIKDVGKRTGDETVAVGFKPDEGWFTIDHPSFKQWRPKFQEVDGKVEAVKDPAGNPVFEQVPIYVRGDFEGPLRAAMWGRSGDAYQAMMSLKGKTMGLIMNSPMIHNLVEFGRAFPAMPTRIVKAYFDGYRAKQDPAVMHEAIDAGLVPIGKRFFNQDITSVMETPDLTPGRSLTAKALALVPGWFDEAAGTAVKRAVDKAGDFWHNTLLWDRIADLQAGLYVNFRSDMIAKGMDQTTASRIAAHFANRYAGALPKEAMSEAATKVANFMLFSRSFTLGNLGVMKDMLTGLPKDVLAQIERDAGMRAGSIQGAEAVAQEAAQSAKVIARRKAMMVVGLDIGLMYVGNSILQSAFNVMLGDNSLGQEAHEYLRRFRDVMNEGAVHPLSLLNPFGVAERLSATHDNEPGRHDRILVGYAKDGTAIYARNPVGKIGEEFSGYFGSPIDMLRKKQGTIARPLLQILSNDAGFGRKVYDPTADAPAKYAGNVWAIVKHLFKSQLPEGQITALSDIVKGEGDRTVNALQVFGPLAGVTFSKGAPGGPAVGEMYQAKTQHQFAVDQALPDIRKQIKRGDIDGAIGRMTELDVPQGLQRWYIKTTLNPALRMSPRAVRDFYLHATEEQKQRFERARRAMPQ